jgi:hypothetical protein
MTEEPPCGVAEHFMGGEALKINFFIGRDPSEPRPGADICAVSIIDLGSLTPEGELPTTQ